MTTRTADCLSFTTSQLLQGLISLIRHINFLGQVNTQYFRCGLLDAILDYDEKKTWESRKCGREDGCPL